MLSGDDGGWRPLVMGGLIFIWTLVGNKINSYRPESEFAPIQHAPTQRGFSRVCLALECVLLRHDELRLQPGVNAQRIL